MADMLPGLTAGFLKTGMSCSLASVIGGFFIFYVPMRTGGAAPLSRFPPTSHPPSYRDTTQIKNRQNRLPNLDRTPPQSDMITDRSDEDGIPLPQQNAGNHNALLTLCRDIRHIVVKANIENLLTPNHSHTTVCIQELSFYPIYWRVHIAYS
jgi:hypothetical protein